FRKSGEIVILVLAYVVQIAIALPINIFMFISIYVCVMEVLSVIENLDQAGLPVPSWITRRLKKAMDTMVTGGEEEEHMEHQEHKEDTEE
ncbi:MAG: phage holin family protein, partial [Lachnospiraceae bacterium]|nr:phage holin family protein [Lachnospiraceae bacterium]